jgi:hypothetical protein
MFDSVPSDAVGYVASAYLFFLLMVLIYIAILGAKFQRISRDLGELIDEIEADREEDSSDDSPVREESSV